MRKIASTGNTLTEYGFLIGLVAIASVAGLKFLGGSTSDALGSVNDNKHGLMNMMHMNFQESSASIPQGSVSLKGSGYYTQIVNPETGELEFKLTDGINGVATNTTSLDGSQWNILGQFRLADTLLQLAEKEKDPANKNFIMQLAEKSYYMGAAEGEIDGIGHFQFKDLSGDENAYGKVNGYNDIRRLQGDIRSLLNNPPDSLNKETLQQVNALSLDVYNIAQTYVNVLKPLVENPDRKYDFYTTKDDGNDTPGLGLTLTSKDIVMCPHMGCGNPQSNGPTVEKTFQLSEIKTLSAQVLADQKVASEPVKVTWKDATQMEQKATTETSTNTH